MPKIGIIMGSNSDLPIMKEAAAVLQEMGIDYSINIVSAHRTPDFMYSYSKSIEEKGISIIIAGAGGSAHLPGMVASLTCVPVIGVPIKSSALDGIDSLLSIVQMPAGVPVATVGINAARNAGILAARILGIKHPKIRMQLEKNIKHTSETIEPGAEE
ncbi:MAG: 5-(carboxyamino)imidazole ribonucleotide mutase [Christensenellales bacterium]